MSTPVTRDYIDKRFQLLAEVMGEEVAKTQNAERAKAERDMTSLREAIGFQATRIAALEAMLRDHRKDGGEDNSSRPLGSGPVGSFSSLTGLKKGF